VSQQLALDFCDQKGEVGAIEAQPRRGDAMMFDVRGDVFVVWIAIPPQVVGGERMRAVPLGDDASHVHRPAAGLV